MTNTDRIIKTCGETKAIQTRRVLPGDLNTHQTLFGGKLMSIIDNTASISVARLVRSKQFVTASMDKLDFLHPIKEGHSVCVETYVSGVGNTSVEIFAKVLGEDLVAAERYIAATSFITFVLTAENRHEMVLPAVQPETREERMICEGYEQRREKRLADREFNVQFAEAVSLLPPWLSEDNETQ